MCSVTGTSPDWGLLSPDASAPCCHETQQSCELLFEEKYHILNLEHEPIWLIDLKFPHTHWKLIFQ